MTILPFVCMHVNIKQIYDICYQFNLYNFTLGPNRHSVFTRLEQRNNPATGKRKSSERYGYKVTAAQDDQHCKYVRYDYYK